MLLIFLFTCMVTGFNTGLIWTIQLVHYPGFNEIGKANYKTYQQLHMKRILRLVGPSMLIELLLSVFLVFQLKEHAGYFLYLVSFALLIFIWIHTAFLASPIHAELLDGFNAKKVSKLIRVNWFRTIAWTIRSIILTMLFIQFVGG